MSWKGSSSIDSGFVIDLRDMNRVDVFPEEHRVTLGPGSVWQHVYSTLAPYNLTVVGGRINEIGVGGFLAGGKCRDLLQYPSSSERKHFLTQQ